MLIYYSLAIAGAIFGFLLFLTNLESEDMKGVLIRVDQTGQKKCNPCGLVPYIIDPFLSRTLWYPQLLGVNWIVMTTVFAVCGLLFAHLLSNCF